MTHLLSNGDLLEESREALLQTILAACQALAVEKRMPEPSALEEITTTSGLLENGLSCVQEFISKPDAPWLPVAQALQDLLERA